VSKTGGFTREELGFALWYLCEKGYARIDDQTRYGILTAGVDFVESKLTEDESELGVIAAVQIPGQATAPALPVQSETLPGQRVERRRQARSIIA
jgi:hypothetical protein